MPRRKLCLTNTIEHYTIEKKALTGSVAHNLEGQDCAAPAAAHRDHSRRQQLLE